MASPSVEDDEENFAEDECTIEFGEEEPTEANGYPSSAVVGGPRFVEYPGEDYSKYLTEASLTTPAVNGDSVVCNQIFRTFQYGAANSFF